MKKVLYIVAISSFMLASCGDSSSNGESHEGDNNNNASTENTDAGTNMNTEDIGSGNDRTAEDPYANSATQPKILFDHVEHAFGKVIEGEKVKHTYTFKNEGTADLLIINAKASCGCTVPDWTKDPIKPGESGEITAEFNSAGRLGNNTKEITVEANTNPPIHKLRFTCEVVKDAE